MCLAYPMQVMQLKGKHAVVDAQGIRREVNIEFLKGLKVGDYVMIHAGFAIERYDAKKARQTLEYVKEYMDGIRKSSKR
ncbi:MAG: HypC/HybG/HupF family hydrogenase formation chaperone [Candidatus Omnitrophota bacterium]|nr:MAG: HypC/HybG/HupF family hydrogenase formation chaperone [Candidatus Omnitrophota bacterium]